MQPKPNYYEELDSVDIEPVYNKKRTRVIAWKLVITYGHDALLRAPGCATPPVFHETRNEYHTFANFFGLGHKYVLNLKNKMLAKAKENTK